MKGDALAWLLQVCLKHGNWFRRQQSCPDGGGNAGFLDIVPIAVVFFPRPCSGLLHFMPPSPVVSVNAEWKSMRRGVVWLLAKAVTRNDSRSQRTR